MQLLRLANSCKSRISPSVLQLILVYGALLFAQATFGGAAVVYRFSLRGISPVTFLFFRQLVSGPILVGTSYAVERTLPKLQDLPSFALCGFIFVFLGQLTYILGVYFSGAIIASVCQLIQAPLVSILAILLGMEKFSWIKLAGLATSVSGALVLILGNGFNIGTSGDGTKSLGIVILFAQSIFSSFGVILQKQIVENYPPMITSAFVNLFSVPWAVLLAVSVIRGDAWSVSPSAMWGLAYAVIVIGLVAGSLYSWAVKKTDSSIVAAAVTLNPFVATILAAIFLGETILLKDIIGGALILTGFVVTSVAKIRETRQEEEAKRKADPERAELLDEQVKETESAPSVSDTTDMIELTEIESLEATDEEAPAAGKEG